MLCETNVDDCHPGACLNGGTCVDGVNEFHCLCSAGFVGRRCEGDVNECRWNPCTGSGSLACVQLVNGFQCVCLDGWTGKLCDSEMLGCSANPCLNNGKCVDTVNGVNCLCGKVGKVYVFL